MIFTLSHKQFNKSDSPFLLFSCKKKLKTELNL